MKRFGVIKIFGWALLATIAVAAHAAATVRGKVVHNKDKTAAAGYKITVSNENGRTTPARVGSDGMYYIYNVAPGPYQLEIWLPDTASPMLYKIQVVEPYTDVPELAVP